MTRFVQMSPKHLLKYQWYTVKHTNTSRFQFQFYFHMLQILLKGKALANLQSFPTCSHLVITPATLDRARMHYNSLFIDKNTEAEAHKEAVVFKALHFITGRAITPTYGFSI